MTGLLLIGICGAALVLLTGLIGFQVGQAVERGRALPPLVPASPPAENTVARRVAVVEITVLGGRFNAGIEADEGALRQLAAGAGFDLVPLSSREVH